MTKPEIKAALNRRLPFTLLMSDGQSYRVPHEDYISFPPTAERVVVYDDLGHIWVLNLNEMTSIQYEEQKQP